MKTILVPTDFSTPAQTAASVAADIAKKASAKVLLLHVIELPGGESFNVTGETSAAENWQDKIFTLKLIEKRKRELSEEVDLLKTKGIEVGYELRLGNAYHGITAIISEKEVDLVVMGTSMRPKLEEIIIGSNTRKV